jgi:probable F420-dependent oxidoreductase
MTASTPLRVGIQLHPQATTVDAMRRAWSTVDEMGADSIWTWDHFFPLYGEPDAEHFEGWTLLSVMAADTSRAKLGMLVSGNSYRNPELLADMARTLDHVSGGRMYLGVGAGWFERDYDEYGYEFGTPGSRLNALADALPRVEARWAKLNPPPTRDIPIMIGGKGEQKTLRIVAQHADIWHSFVRPDDLGHKLDVLARWGEKVGRDVSQITVSNELNRRHADAGYADALYDAGVRLFTLALRGPEFDLDIVRHYLAWRDAKNG